MNRAFAFTLGTLSAIGGFIDIGDLVADAQVGARFGLRLAWVSLFTVAGIMCFSEMAGRVALKTQRPALALARSRLGPRFGLFGLIGSLLVTALLVMAEPPASTTCSGSRWRSRSCYSSSGSCRSR